MPRPSGGFTREFGRVVAALLGKMSLEQAAIKLNYELSGMTISRLKSGRVGLEQTVRTFARGFADRICEVFGDEVRARFGECSAEAAEDWLAEKAGFQPQHFPEHGLDDLSDLPGNEQGLRRIIGEVVSEELSRALGSMRQVVEETAELILARGARDLSRRWGRPVLVEYNGMDTMTPDEARKQIESLERELREEYGEPPNPHGS